MADEAVGKPNSSRATKRLGALLLVLASVAVTVYFVTRPDPDALKQRARIALQNRKYGKALELAEKVLNGNPKEPEAARLAGDACVGSKQFERAVEFFDRVPKAKTKESIDARLKSGRILMYELGQAWDAENRFRSVLNDDPHHSAALYELATLLGVLTRQRESVPYVLKLLRQQKVDLDLLTLIGGDDGALARPELLALYRRKTPRDPSVLLADAWNARNSRTGIDTDQARRILETAVQQHPRFLPLRHALAELLWQQQRLPELATHLRTSFDAGDVPPSLWIIRGKLAERDGKLHRAARCYWEAFRRAPTDRRAVYDLSRMASKLGSSASADRLRRRLVALRNVKQISDVVLSTEHESLEPLYRLSIALEQVERLWEAWGWCQVAGWINPNENWPRRRSATLWTRLKKCPDSKVCTSDLALEVDFSSEPLPEWKNIPNSQSRSTESLPRITFRDDAAKTGIEFRYYNSPNDPKRGQRMFEFPGGGCAVIDYDGDGWPDLYFTQGCRWPVQSQNVEFLDRLYRNLGNGRFEEVTLSAGLLENRFSGGVAVGDFDNDGFPDLYVANVGINRLYHNNGDGTFEDVTAFAGVGDPLWSTSCVIADLNGDSLPDIYSVNYLSGHDVFERICRHNDGRPRMCMPFHFPAAQDQLFLNQGDGRFRNVTAASSVVVKDGKGLGVVGADLTGDGKLELFVANDTVMNSLFVNRTEQQNSGFQLVEHGLERGVAVNGLGRAEGSMGIAVGDVDEDGRPDLLVTNFHHETNTLYLQREPGLFSDRTREFGLAASSREMLGFGAQFFDANLDGWLDLVVTNGHIDDLSAYGRPYRMPSQFYFNRGGAQFALLPPEMLGPHFREKVLGRSLATLDWNRDGKEDFVISFLDRPAAVVTNTTMEVGNALTLRFRGVHSARDAIGVSIRSTIGDRILTRQLTAGSGYQASNQQHVVIGLGNSDRVERLEVRWPSGHRQTFHGVAANQELLFIESAPQPLRCPR